MSTIEESGLSETTHVGEQARDPGNEASRFKAAASRVYQDSKAAAQRWGRQSRVVAVGAKDRIKDDPVRSVAISFVIGLSLGALVGRLSGRQCQ